MKELAELADKITSLRRSGTCPELFLGTLARQLFSCGASAVAFAVDQEGGIWASADAALASDRTTLSALCARRGWGAVDAAFLATDAPHFVTAPAHAARRGAECLAFCFDADRDGLWAYRSPQWWHRYIATLET